jgi:CheY-like chemotaxis protein
MPDPTTASSTPLRVLVVDADERIRESIVGLLPIGGRCLVVGSAGEPNRALELAEAFGPDVVMVDSRVCEMEGGDRLIDRLRAFAPGLRIVVLSWSSTAGPQPHLGGADAYIRKTFRTHELIDAVVNTVRASAG